MQLATENIVMTLLPQPADLVKFYLVTVSVGVVRRRTLEFIVTEQDARTIARLTGNPDCKSRFAMSPSDVKFGFMSVESVRWDHHPGDQQPTYAVNDVTKITRLA